MALPLALHNLGLGWAASGGGGSQGTAGPMTPMGARPRPTLPRDKVVLVSGATGGLGRARHVVSGNGYLLGMTSQRPVAAVTDAQDTDLVAEAVGATSAAYTRNPSLDVRQHLEEELARRGVGRRSPAWMDHVAEAIRAGHSEDLVRDPSRQFPTKSEGARLEEH